MKRLLIFILLLLPFLGFGQAEKPYRSIIVDSVKALNGGRIDVKDTLLLDSLAVYNTDLSSQYTSRSLVDSAFVGVAVSSGGSNTIYNADDNLAGNRVVTMGGNSLEFSGNKTTFKGIDATGSNFVALFQDNVGTDLLSVRNDGNVDFGTAFKWEATSKFLTLNGLTSTNSITIDPNSEINLKTLGVIQVEIRRTGSLKLFNASSVNHIRLDINTTSFIGSNNGVGFGINTGATISASLHVRSHSAGVTLFALKVDNNALTEPLLYLQNNGQSGFGIAEPEARVHIRDDVGVGVSIVQIHNDRSAVNSTNILSFSFDNSVNDEEVYACFAIEIKDNTDGSEDGDLAFKTIQNGTLSEKATLFSTGNFGIDDSLSVGKNHPDDGFVADFLGHIKADSTISTPFQATTLGVAATTFEVFSNLMVMTGDGGGNTVATITSGKNGTLLTMIFNDANITITDDNTHAANSLDLSGNFNSADDATLQVVFDGTSWYEVSRSTN